MQIEKAYGAFMKIPTPKGQHAIVFEFKPLPQSWMFYVPFVGCFFLLGFGFLIFFRNRLAL